MRLFAGFTLLALGLFWSYPFLAPGLERTLRSKVGPWPDPREPVLVLAPKDIRGRPGETAAVNLADNALTENSADPRR